MEVPAITNSVTLGTVTDGKLPQVIQPEVEAPITGEKLKLAATNGAFKRSQVEDGTSQEFCVIFWNVIRMIYCPYITK